jgi:hypothetical protein
MLRLRKLGRRSMDLEFPIGWGRTCRVLERPGTWMESTALARVVADLRLVAGRAVRHGTLAYGALTGERERLAQAVLTIVYERTRRPVAFSAMVFLPVELQGHKREILHMGLALVDPEARGRNLSRSVYGVTMLLLFLRGGLRPLWVTNVSQVPSAIGSFATYFDDAYPALDSDCRTPEHFAIAEQVMGRHRQAFGVGADAAFDLLRFVIQDAYTGGSDNLKKPYTEAARHRRSSYGRLCLSTLDYDRGDDFFQVGRYTAFVVWRCFVRRVRHHPLVAAFFRPKAPPVQLRHDS